MPNTATMPTAAVHRSHQEGDWPVQVFRRTGAKGWNVNEAACFCTPKSGCIEIRKLRLRIHLSPGKPQQNRTDENTIAATATKSTQSVPLVVRRQNTILVSLDAGAIVLKFRNKADCLSFSDRLVSLNPSTAVTNGATAKNVNNNVANHSNRFASAGRTEPSNSEESRALKRQKRSDIHSYMVRLLHDDDFLGFVNDLEQSLKSSKDGSSILAALEMRNKSLLPK